MSKVPLFPGLKVVLTFLIMWYKCNSYLSESCIVRWNHEYVRFNEVFRQIDIKLHRQWIVEAGSDLVMTRQNVAWCQVTIHSIITRTPQCLCVVTGDWIHQLHHRMGTILHRREAHLRRFDVIWAYLPVISVIMNYKKRTQEAVRLPRKQRPNIMSLGGKGPIISLISEDISLLRLSPQRTGHNKIWFRNLTEAP